jgi:hypothetical protein
VLELGRGGGHQRQQAVGTFGVPAGGGKRALCVVLPSAHREAGQGGQGVAIEDTGVVRVAKDLTQTPLGRVPVPMQTQQPVPVGLPTPLVRGKIVVPAVLGALLEVARYFWVAAQPPQQRHQVVVAPQDVLVVTDGTGQLQTAEQLIEPRLVTELQPGAPAIDQPHGHQVARVEPLGHRQRLVDPPYPVPLLVDVDQDHRQVQERRDAAETVTGALEQLGSPFRRRERGPGLQPGPLLHRQAGQGLAQRGIVTEVLAQPHRHLRGAQSIAPPI